MAYSIEDKNKILDSVFKEIENGSSLRLACKKNKIPPKTFYEWIDDNPDKSKQYARALELRAELKFESIEEDYMTEPQRDAETGRIDPAWVNLQRLKIDAKKWELSKMMPKKYGDRIDIDHTTKGKEIVSVNNFKNLSLDDIKKLEELSKKIENTED